MRISPRCGTRGALQAEGSVGVGQGQGGKGTGAQRSEEVEELEEAGGSWEASLLAALPQLSKLLACSGCWQCALEELLALGGS